jgi:excisionase family DNA binding protein
MTFSVKQITEKLTVTELTVLGWIHSGQLVAINVGRTPGKLKPRWRIREEDFEAFIHARSTKPKPSQRKRVVLASNGSSR